MKRYFADDHDSLVDPQPVIGGPCDEHEWAGLEPCPRCHPKQAPRELGDVLREALSEPEGR